MGTVAILAQGHLLHQSSHFSVFSHGGARRFRKGLRRKRREKEKERERGRERARVKVRARARARPRSGSLAPSSAALSRLRRSSPSRIFSCTLSPSRSSRS